MRQELACSRRREARARFWVRVCALAALVTLGFLAFSGTARASGKRVAVYVDGADDEHLSAELVAALPSGVSVIDSSELTEALSQEHVKSVSGAFTSAKRHRALPAKLQRVATAIGADAVVLGALDDDASALTLMVVIAGQPTPEVDESVPVTDKAERVVHWKKLVTEPLQKLSAPATDTDAADKASSPGQPAEPDETGSRNFSDALVTGFAAIDFGARQMHYRDRVSNANLRPYDLPSGALLPVAPGFSAFAEVFPLASTRWVGLRDIGLNGRFNYNLASSRVGDVTPSTRWFGYEINLRGRFLLGPRHSAPLIGVEGGVGRQAFLFSAPGAVQDILPSVDYYYLRFGVDGRIPIGAAAVLVGTAYRHVQSRRGPSGDTVPAAGAFGEHFPHADISGLDFKLGGAIALADRIEARLVLNYVRYWSTLHPSPGDTYVAGGALDQILNADLGVAASF
jgi:hypothetical protein